AQGSFGRAQVVFDDFLEDMGVMAEPFDENQRPVLMTQAVRPVAFDKIQQVVGFAVEIARQRTDLAHLIAIGKIIVVRVKRLL
ncbi:hypothetical protein DF186_21620, partial [Enterococcus hirae]